MQVQVKELPGDEGREDPGQTGKGVWGVILNVPVRGKGRMTMLFGIVAGRSCVKMKTAAREMLLDIRDEERRRCKKSADEK